MCVCGCRCGCGWVCMDGWVGGSSLNGCSSRCSLGPNGLSQPGPVFWLWQAPRGQTVIMGGDQSTAKKLHCGCMQ
jgi:hypothetical protein